MSKRIYHTDAEDRDHFARLASIDLVLGAIRAILHSSRSIDQRQRKWLRRLHAGLSDTRGRIVRGYNLEARSEIYGYKYLLNHLNFK